MCLLNGDLAGALPHTTDFGIEEYYDAKTNITTYTSVPIARIIRESVQNFGNELAQNIIINDLEDAGLELLEYRGDVPIFMFREVNSDSFLNMSLNSYQRCYIKNENEEEEETNLSDKRIKYDNLVNLAEGEEATQISFSPGGKKYTVAKFEYGSIPGYRLTDLVYAGDLISNVGETLTSMLDKIVNMLGEFEYFYNLDGKFVFQKKQTYVDVYWNNVEKNTDEKYANAAVNKSVPMWNFIDGQLISAFQNTPNLLNLRNDFAVWGKKKLTSGTELDIHMRYAIDTKPTEYYSLIDQKQYATYDKSDKDNPVTIVDWRELIYKMALDYRKYYHNDDFLYNLAKANPQYPDGRTGYEQYYVDMEGFWRQIYNPKENVMKFQSVEFKDLLMNYSREQVYIKYPLVKASKEILLQTPLEDVYYIEEETNNLGQKSYTLKPFLQGYCKLDIATAYWYKDTTGRINSTLNIPAEDDWPYGQRGSFMNATKITEFLIANTLGLKDKENKYLQVLKEEGKKENYLTLKAYKYSVGSTTNDSIRYVDAEYQRAIQKNAPLYVFSEECIKLENLDSLVQNLYWPKDSQPIETLSYGQYDNFGHLIENGKTTSRNINYQVAYYEFNDSGWAKEVTDNPENLLFWFDFIDPEEADLAKFSVKAVGTRSKALNDKDVKSIYYREIPKTIFQSGLETFEHQTGYTYIQLQGTMENLFIISSKGKSAQEAIEELLYKYSYCIESTNITALPVYHLQPNTRVLIRDQKSGIDGEYAVSKITIPLTYNGTMSLTASKVVTNIAF